MLSVLSRSHLEQITGGKGLGKDPDQPIAQISIDSRQVLHPEQTLFVALKGAKADGISFIPELLEVGVAYFWWMFKQAFLPLGSKRGILSK